MNDTTNAPTVVGDDISPDLSHKSTVDLFDPKAKHTAKQRRAAMRARQSKVYGRPPANATEKYIAKLGTLTMQQLVRRLKQAARWSSHFKHEIARSDTYVAAKLRPLHDLALMRFARVKTEIEFRTEPKEV
jgi:hypothetical protein